MKDLMAYFLPVCGCVKYLVSDELEHCAQWPQRKKACRLIRQPGDSVRWFFSVRVNQSVFQIAATFKCDQGRHRDDII